MPVDSQCECLIEESRPVTLLISPAGEPVKGNFIFLAHYQPEPPFLGNTRRTRRKNLHCLEPPQRSTLILLGLCSYTFLSILQARPCAVRGRSSDGPSLVVRNAPKTHVLSFAAPSHITLIALELEYFSRALADFSSARSFVHHNPRFEATDLDYHNSLEQSSKEADGRAKLQSQALWSLALCVFSSPYSSPRNILSTITTPHFITEERQGQSPGWAYGPEISHSSHTSYPSTLGLSGWGGVIL